MKAQATTEFIIIFMLLLVALSIVAAGSFSNMLDMTKSKKELEATGIANKISAKINTAFLEGPGFKANLTLPYTIYGLNYTANMEGNFVTIDLDGLVYSRPLLTRNITGGPLPGPNMVENREGVIVITQL
ncbi:MAG: hypothetical protein ACE5FW_01045 [Candidatus Aenigmatarchaeota archaeon]